MCRELIIALGGERVKERGSWERVTENVLCMINSNNPRLPNPEPVQKLQVSSNVTFTFCAGGQSHLFLMERTIIPVSVSAASVTIRDV